jgi:hypothetical protein
MSRRSIAIFADADAFRIAPVGRAREASIVEVPVPPDASPETRCATLGEALKAGGFSGARALLLLPSTQCLCATIPIADLPMRQRGQAMLYRFEEKLPIAAEEIAADFISGESTALAVGVERRVLEPLTAAVREAGVRLSAVCPASLLVLQGLIESQRVAAGDEWVCWPAAAGRVELIRLAARVPAAWYVTSDDAGDVVMHVRAADGSGTTQSVTACGMPAEFVERLTEAGLTAESGEWQDVRQSATDAAAAVLANRWLPCVNFADSGGAARGGGFAATGAAARIAVAALVVFAASLVAALVVRAARYERLTAGYESQQHEVFRRLFPDAAVPVDVRSRLKSEARVAGGGDGSPQPDAVGGLLVLRDLLTNLPGETRFRVSELRLDRGAFTLEGDVPTHGDAEAIAVALRRRDGFEVQSPRTEQRGPVVGFTIIGKAGKATLKQNAGAVATLERRASR